MKLHVLMVALLVYLPSAFAKPINEPCVIERAPLTFAKCFAEFGNSRLYGWELGPQIAINVFGPIDGDWINFRKFTFNNSLELPSFTSKMLSIASINRESMNSDNSKESNTSTNRPKRIFAEDIAHWLPLLLAFIVAIWSGISKT
ncbi:MAG: hypothetical protein OEV28_11020 [Nitrospirota bacterium]|nr:hypothetical protein [Nitrospirota bacterium]